MEEAYFLKLQDTFEELDCTISSLSGISVGNTLTLRVDEDICNCTGHYVMWIVNG